MDTAKFLASLVLIAGLSGTVSASPLRMDYTVTDLGVGSYQYDFTLSLDNHDNTWVAGQGWDYVFFGPSIFGQRVPLENFVPTQGSLSNADWTFGSTTVGSTPLSSSMTNVPAVRDTTLSQSPWIPSAVGDFFTWSGTSTANLLQGDMRFSAVFPSGGALSFLDQVANRHEAELPPTPVPLPSSISLLCAGIVGIMFTRRSALRRTNASNAT